MPWEFWIDRGGTFTDCIGRAPDGALHTAKRLSSDAAPVEAIRAVLERAGAIAPGASLPACRVELGSTVATNALLERRGTPTVLVADRGLGDVLAIGTQERPHLFALRIDKAPPLQRAVVEVGGRVGADGVEVEPFDADAARRALRRAREAGCRAAAVVLAHAYAFPARERELVTLAREAGFEYVVASHEIAREMGLLARGETTAADAYLTPLLRSHVARLREALPGSRLRFMQSSGGLTTARRYRGPNALLSGPAGGVVGAARVAARAGFASAVAFDMGGTSTDVSLVENGEVERAFETLVGGVRVRAPMLRIHTIAAGGGSLCRFDGVRLTVGPESAGAEPGPLCYGHAEARELALTDVNLFLGRVQPDRFPFALRREPVELALDALRERLAEAGFARTREEVAAGFVAVANASMAQAVQQVSVARGVDPRDHVLVGFGGAGGQHVCAVARELGIRTVLLHPFAGLLSAYGIGLAEQSWDGQRDAGRAALPASGEPLPEDVERILGALAERGRAALAAEDVAEADLRIERWLDLRYAGSESPLAVREPEDGDWARRFAAEHEARFGYTRPGRTVEIVTARVRARAGGADALAAPPARAAGGADAGADGTPEPLRRAPVWFPGAGFVSAPVFEREALAPGAALAGPAVVLEDTGTVILDPGFRARVDPDGVLLLTDELAHEKQASDEGASARRDGGRRAAAEEEAPPLVPPQAGEARAQRASEEANGRRAAGERSSEEMDPVALEVFGNRFMSIASQMGAVLRNTSFSTNIKERLDYSCAVFDPEGGLVANAPHIPVHLGAMGETVRAVLQRFPDLAPGDVVCTNDPFAGGSHLPDVTVVTPVFLPEDDGGPAFFVASRGHHADLGGATPGSMPPDSRRLEEEGVVLEPFRLVRDGQLDEARVRALLAGARFPARRPDDNLADLVAMVAANRAGERLLRELVGERGRRAVAARMRQLQQAAARKVAREIGRLADGEHAAEDQMDDGTPVRVRLTVRGERMRIDFAGTGAAVPGNLNAPRAVVHAAVIYVLRTLVDEPIPLNGGCLEPVEIAVPPGSLLDPPPGSAVVGGNVETSQRVVDVLLRALGRAAASQGTMNNVTFGDESFGYYETIGGGAGAGPGFDGASGVHTHMTNTRITDVEVLESRTPVRIREFSLRAGSGGAGRWRGGDGLVRRYLFLRPVTVALLTERRRVPPWGADGGAPGATGRNCVERADGSVEELGGRVRVELAAGDGLRVETPGGGGFGAPETSAEGGQRSPGP